MACICSIIPPHILSAIAGSDAQVSDHVRDACQSTLRMTRIIRAARIEHAHAVGAQHGEASHQGIIPPHIHEEIALRAGGQLHETSLRTLRHDTEFCADRVKKLNRIVYDFQQNEDETDLPGDTVAIKEGGDPVSTKSDPSNDANECYKGLEITYNFYLKFFQRNSLNNKGMKLTSTVHFGKRYNNALWDGRYLIFGDGDGEIFNGFTDELDVIGHELTHGVVQYEANLEYQDQSGALNESMADCFGVMVKQWNGGVDSQTADQANWLIGEGIWASGIRGIALRSMRAPGTAYNDPRVGKDPQPAHMKDYVKGKSDNGGVHINSGIPNHAFYLAATKIGGYAWEGAGVVWYKTLTSPELTSKATFQEFANISYRNAGKWTDEVVQAWNEVGIPVDKRMAKL